MDEVRGTQWPCVEVAGLSVCRDSSCEASCMMFVVAVIPRCLKIGRIRL